MDGKNAASVSNLGIVQIHRTARDQDLASIRLYGPEAILATVDFPAPLAPIRATTSPG